MAESALLEVAWTDPVTGCRGYLVIDRLVRGVASGGLRMRRGCTLFEVRGLARGMTLKEGLNYDPDGLMENVGDMLGIVGRRIEGDLHRFKQFVQARVTETGAWRGEIHGGHETSTPA